MQLHQKLLRIKNILEALKKQKCDKLEFNEPSIEGNKYK